MTEAEIFDKIVEIVDPLDPITQETVVRECADIDSLALFNIVFFYIYYIFKTHCVIFNTF